MARRASPQARGEAHVITFAFKRVTIIAWPEFDRILVTDPLVDVAVLLSFDEILEAAERARSYAD